MSRLPMGLALIAGAVLAAALFWIVTGPLQARLEAAGAARAALEAEAVALQARVDGFRVAGASGALGPELRLPGATRAEAAVALQERLVDLAGAHGVVLTSFVEGAVPEGLSHPAVAVVIEGEGAYDDVVRLLAALEGQAPPVALSQMMLRPVTGGGVSLRLLAWGFVQGEAG